jgi:hypothetical protein
MTMDPLVQQSVSTLLAVQNCIADLLFFFDRDNLPQKMSVLCKNIVTHFNGIQNDNNTNKNNNNNNNNDNNNNTNNNNNNDNSTVTAVYVLMSYLAVHRERLRFFKGMLAWIWLKSILKEHGIFVAQNSPDGKKKKNMDNISNTKKIEKDKQTSGPLNPLKSEEEEVENSPQVEEYSLQDIFPSPSTLEEIFVKSRKLSDKSKYPILLNVVSLLYTIIFLDWPMFGKYVKEFDVDSVSVLSRSVKDLRGCAEFYLIKETLEAISSQIQILGTSLFGRSETVTLDMFFQKMAPKNQSVKESEDHETKE